MATSNFKTMENFPLIVAETPMMRVCPECNMAIVDNTLTECDNCGASLENVREEVDECAADWLNGEMEAVADRINEVCRFHEVTVESGYYSGVQFYVEEKFDPNINDNWDCQYSYGMCRSRAIRSFEAEVRRVTKMLRKAAEELGLMELAQAFRFSNGECIYTKVEPKKAAANKVVKGKCTTEVKAA